MESALFYLFGGVLLLGGVGRSQLVLHTVSVLQFFHLINPDQPVLRREGFLQVLQLYVLVADLGVACPVEARWRPEVQLGREIELLTIRRFAGKPTRDNFAKFCRGESREGVPASLRSGSRTFCT